MAPKRCGGGEMKDLNMVFLMGNLTRDPDLRYTPNGQAVASLTVATNRRWNDQNTGEQKEAAEFTDVVVWGKMAENVANYMRKGRRIHIIGRLQTRSWEAQDGSKKYKTEVIASDITFLDRAGAGAASEGIDEIPEDDVNQAPEKDSKKPTLTGDSGGGNKKKGEKSDGKKDDKPTDEVDIEDIPF